MYNPRLLSFLERLAENKDHRLLSEAYEAIGLEFEDIDYEIKEPLHF
jgi:hypothetical protein